MGALSPYVLAPALAFILAQATKNLIVVLRRRDQPRPTYRTLHLSGGMPSAHAASVTALTLVVAVRDGLDSGLFGVVLLFAAVVVYDAMMVRRSSGEQGVALLGLLEQAGRDDIKPRVARGHTPFEVVAGGLVGALIAGVVILAT